MKIYIDLLLILNFGFDFLLLIATSYILKRNITIKRIIYGSLVGTLSMLFLFIPMSSFVLFLFKILVSIIMIIVTFSYKNIKYMTKNIIHLYLNSIILGGFLYLLNIQFSYKQVGLVFYHNGLSINFILLIILSPIIIYVYVKQIRSYKANIKNYYKIEFKIKNQYNLNAFIDTGNKLRSIYFNKEIHIINKGIIKENVNYFYEPIVTVNGTSMMKCFKVKKVFINHKEYNNVIFGISNEYFNLDVDVILNNKIWEAENVQVD